MTFNGHGNKENTYDPIHLNVIKTYVEWINHFIVLLAKNS